jgi:hypothetical protein
MTWRCRSCCCCCCRARTAACAGARCAAMLLAQARPCPKCREPLARATRVYEE